ncbi:energy-coupling factor ABC transporter ATP-binding protein [Dehalogenimonas etheniformans]|uniref:ABC transporter ATP-binding protein n=1 Tax=Dehalogenimonas etheniformans TaxID=1536648 RepID=A0A2P5P6E9_9CHLR|nr:ABC transporter ATP-binding protein [Dehalogenimonas etheniformans]PPD57873.1 ABC transporter ATP-binding protein [Dehalogenimonas etheniformans]QNT75474.1 ABC transporter ATP-binding protein [Dehalogenimonas etheniformans]
MNDPVIRLDDLTYTYPDGRRALESINLSIAKGESVAIAGANGAGKSTLLMHLNGIIHGTNGAVKVCGIPVVAANLKTIRARVGVVFQNPDDQLFCPEVFDDVAFGPINMGLPEGEIKKRVGESLAAVGLSGYEKRSSHHLSLGEKKRIALASVLSMQPEVLALDEPSSNLDPAAKWGLIQLLKSLDVTKIVVSHDLELIEALCPRLVIMSKGKILADGETCGIMKNRELLVAGGLAAPG